MTESQPRSSHHTHHLNMTNVLDNYELGEVLGNGHLGKVQKAMNMSTGEVVAIRILRKSPSVDDTTSLMEQFDILKRFDSPNIVKYISCGKDHDSLVFIMEWVPGGSLADILRNFGPCPEPLVAIYIKQVLQALKYLHDKDAGYVHAGIKASNLLISNEGVLKLVDPLLPSSTLLYKLSTMKRKNDNDNDSDEPMLWSAPEIVQGDVPGMASDIWSVGITAIELLCGRPPFADMNPIRAAEVLLKGEIPPLPSISSAKFRDFLMRCFCKDPADRSSAGELLRHPWLIGEEIESGSGLKPLTIKEVRQTIRLYNKTMRGLNKKKKKHERMDMIRWEETMRKEKEGENIVAITTRTHSSLGEPGGYADTSLEAQNMRVELSYDRMDRVNSSKIEAKEGEGKGEGEREGEGEGNVFFPYDNSDNSYDYRQAAIVAAKIFEDLNSYRSNVQVTSTAVGDGVGVEGMGEGEGEGVEQTEDDWWAEVAADYEKMLQEGVGVENIEEEEEEAAEKKKEEEAAEKKKEEEAAEKKRLEEEAAEKKILEEEEAEKRRLEEEAAEKRRLEEEAAEKKRLEEEAVEKKRLEEEAAEKKRLEEEAAEKKRLEEEAAEKKKEEEAAEKRRLEEEAAEKKRLEEEAAEKKRLEEEAAEKKRLEEAEQEKRKHVTVKAEHGRTSSRPRHTPTPSHKSDILPGPPIVEIAGSSSKSKSGKSRGGASSAEVDAFMRWKGWTHTALSLALGAAVAGVGVGGNDEISQQQYSWEDEPIGISGEKDVNENEKDSPVDDAETVARLTVLESEWGLDPGLLTGHMSDDPSGLSVSVCNTEARGSSIGGSYTVYQIVMRDTSRGASQPPVTVFRRYRRFKELHDSLSELDPPLPDTMPTLPPKKVFGNLDPEFVAERKLALSRYLQILIDIPGAMQTDEVRSFFNLQ